MKIKDLIVKLQELELKYPDAPVFFDGDFDDGAVFPIDDVEYDNEAGTVFLSDTDPDDLPML